MKKVLLICYYFPPLGGAGVGRPLGLVKHVSRFGWECHVLTVKPVSYRVYEPELLHGLPTEKIYRAGSFDPQRLLYLIGVRQVPDKTIDMGRVVSNRFFPDPKVGWVRKAVGLGRTLISNNRYDALMSTSPPISAHLVGMQLARESRLPWIADFRDYWTAYPIEETYASRAAVSRAGNLLQDVRRTSTMITAVNRTVGDYVGAGNIINNSYDRDLAERWKLPPDSGSFTVGVLGSLNELTPVEPLLKVLAVLRSTVPDVFAGIRVLQVGSVDINWLTPQLEHYALADKFEVRRHQRRDVTIDLLSQTSLLYAGVRDKGFSTGRIYTMLSSGRPILAWAPHGGEMERLVNKTGHSLCFTDDNIETAVTFLRELSRKSKNGECPVVAQPQYAREFSSENMAKQFALVLGKIT